jgi:hypothetical protein
MAFTLWHNVPELGCTFSASGDGEVVQYEKRLTSCPLTKLPYRVLFISVHSVAFFLFLLCAHKLLQYIILLSFHAISMSSMALAILPTNKVLIKR